MNQDIARIIRNISNMSDLVQFEKNANRNKALTPEIISAIDLRAFDFGKALIAQRTGLDVSNLSPAQERIVRAVSEYVTIKKRQGMRGGTEYTFRQLRNRGFLDAAETSVIKKKPTEGYKTLLEAERSDISYEQIIIDHPEEFSSRALWFARRTLGLENDLDRPPSKPLNQVKDNTKRGIAENSSTRNPIWPRDELILALDLYVRFEAKPPKEEIQKLSEFLRNIALAKGLKISPTYRNINGVSMKLSNFRRFDPKYLAQGKIGLPQGSDEEERVWNEFYQKKDILINVAQEVNVANQYISSHDQEPFIKDEESFFYWVFVCNPKKWAIDKFLELNLRKDDWSVRPADRHKFGPGQLGIIRVGNDNRTLAELEGRPRLEAGIYALCEVESEVYEGTGANDGFWTSGEGREVGWPTVNIRYLRVYKDNPLTIEKLRLLRPDLSPLLLDGFQASSFPIEAKDFHEIMFLLGEDSNSIIEIDNAHFTNTLAEMENKYRNASPEVKERISKTIERGPLGNKVKKALGHKCQLCAALDSNPVGFLKPTGIPYVEAHHVMPVAGRRAGSLSTSNIMILCANHHRQMHYGKVSVLITEKTFELSIDGREISLSRYLAQE